jgi:hypothetical protein
MQSQIRMPTLLFHLALETASDTVPRSRQPKTCAATQLARLFFKYELKFPTYYFEAVLLSDQAFVKRFAFDAPLKDFVLKVVSESTYSKRIAYRR